jgi:hypothetical protein
LWLHRRCVEKKFAHEYSFEAAIGFRESHKDLPSFAFIDILDGHDVSQKIIRALDQRLPEFFSKLTSDQRTILVLTSDHGIGDLGSSPTVRLEERIPVSILLTPTAATTGQHMNFNSIGDNFNSYCLYIFDYCKLVFFF